MKLLLEIGLLVAAFSCISFIVAFYIVGGSLKHLWCDGHEYYKEQEFYGDQINRMDARSMWRCHKCGKRRFSQSLGELE